MAHLGEEDARVEDGEDGAGEEDEGAVEDEEAGLVLHDVVAPAAGHFSDTVCCLSAGGEKDREQKEREKTYR